MDRLIEGVKLMGAMFLSVGATRVMTSTLHYEELKTQADLNRLDRYKKNRAGLSLNSAHPQGGNAISEYAGQRRGRFVLPGPRPSEPLCLRCQRVPIEHHGEPAVHGDGARALRRAQNRRHRASRRAAHAGAARAAAGSAGGHSGARPASPLDDATASEWRPWPTRGRSRRPPPAGHAREVWAPGELLDGGDRLRLRYCSRLCRLALTGTRWSWSNAMNSIGARSSFRKSIFVGPLAVEDCEGDLEHDPVRRRHVLTFIDLARSHGRGCWRRRSGTASRSARSPFRG